MCIVAIAWQLFDEMPLVLLSNRDEFLNRPTLPAHQWSDAPIYAGRDEKSGGTWLGIHQNKDPKLPEMVFQNGRWAAVLNFRDGVQANADQRSRGELVANFLSCDMPALDYARHIDLQAYAGFNLIIGDARQAVVVNNRGYPPTPLYSGLHILSNGQPDSDWFKCEHLRSRIRQEVLPLIAQHLESDNTQGIEEKEADWKTAAWDVLSDTCQAPSQQLPVTGVSTDLEQALSSVCIDSPDLPDYGTRTQSILTLSLETNRNNHSLPPKPVLQLESREYPQNASS